MEITPIHKRVIGLDIHQNKISACAIAEGADGTITVEHCEFGGFKRDRTALAQWCQCRFKTDTLKLRRSIGVSCAI